MDVEIEPPHVHHHPTGYHWLDKVLPVCALFVSFVSIFIAYHHGRVMQELVHQNERLVQANSLPHLQIEGSNLSDAGQPEISFRATNAGVGPAEIRTAQVLVDGRPVGDAAQLLRSCCGANNYEGLTTSTLLGSMIRPGQTLAYLRLPVSEASRPAAVALDTARKANRIETRLCYCSVFDECWVRSSRDGDRPRRVAECPAVDTLYRE
ncbi:MAG TPA: hypothetical protein VGD66_02665 [Allosphingosinicella sp.]